MSIPGNGHLPASAGLPDHFSNSDSDAEAEADAEADYLPISGAASDTDTDTEPDPNVAYHHRLDATGNGISALDLVSGDEEEADEECQNPGAAAAAAARARALSEDERWRRAPLPADAAARIVNAMRGVAFPGAPPSWAGSVPEDQWLDRLRSLRGGPN